MAFNLDDDELRATRRMNGSDKNVGSIEEDMERCEQLTKLEHANWIGLSNQHAIEHLIEAYKELKEENEVWKNSYYEQKEFNNKQALYIVEKFIPVSLVEEKIEEIKNETWYIDCGLEAKQSCIEILEELLEKRK